MFYDEQLALMDEADNTGEPYYVVGSDVDIADAEPDQDNTCVSIHGTVRWMLSPDNARDIVSETSDRYKDCWNIVLYYSEEGTAEFGEYHWERGTGFLRLVEIDKDNGVFEPDYNKDFGRLVHRYIPEWAWPKWNNPTEEDRTMAILVDGRRMDSFSMALQETLEDFGKEEVLDNCV